MSFRGPRSPEEDKPLNIWFQRFLTVILFLICLLLLSADRWFPKQTEGLRLHVTDTLAPLVALSSGPVRWGRERFLGFQAYVQATELASQAESLSAEIDILTLGIEQRDNLISELRKNINMPPDGLENYLSARVLIQGSNLFRPNIIVNVGKEDGIYFANGDNAVRAGLAVITQKGLLGRLQSVGSNASSVRLLTDKDSALPVLVGEFRIRATVFGMGSPLLTLTTEEALPGAIRIGDRVTTSSIDPDIPFLFRVGEVVQTSPDIKVLPAASDIPELTGFVQIVLKDDLDINTVDEANL